MSTPSTPRTARSASPGGSPGIMTPGQKIKAMMAAFDSSDEDEAPKQPKPQSKPQFTARKAEQDKAESEEDDEDEDEDEDIIMPKGRMAARMQGQTQNATESTSKPRNETAFERVSKTLKAGKKPEPEQASEEQNGVSSGDDLPAGPRRTNTKENNSGEEASRERSRSFSPLFVSSPQRGEDKSESEKSDNETMDFKGNARLKALIAEKRKAREERERIEAEKKAKRAAQSEQFSSEMNSGDESNDEPGSARKMTQQSRPARKASKKALEEMNRETQRMSRNMQLAHQAQTKKKISKESFFARFNFGQPEEPKEEGPENSSTTAGSQNSSDAEAQKDRETPRTSPVPGPSDKPTDNGTKDLQTIEENGAEDEPNLPSLDELLAAPEQYFEKPTEQAPPPPKVTKPEHKQLTKPPIRVLVSRQAVAQHQQDDSDSDLEVVTSPAKCRRYAAFENLGPQKAQESHALTTLKALAHLTSPTRKTTTMTSAELSANLLYQARQQAAKERKEKIQELRAKGIIIETAEERAAMEDEVENLVEKARKEADDIKREERKAAKGQDAGDEDDDADFELSGSEEEGGFGEEEEDDEEEEEEGEDEEENEEQAVAKDGAEGMIDSEAGEDKMSEDDQTEVLSNDEAEVPAPSRRKRPTRVVSDDEDDVQEPRTPVKPTIQTAHSVERPHIPGSENNDTMSLTQAFAGTLGTQGTQNSAIPPSLPDPGATASLHESDSQMVVKDSQEQRAATPDLFAGYTGDARISESPAVRSMSQFSAPEPTQDAGFVLSPFDPSKRFNGTPHSTIETVLVGRSQNSPIAQRKSKNLRRGRQMETPAEEQGGDFEIDASAFSVMKKAAKKPSEPFDRKKSKAKEVVEDAAEESDDEYAGLGGGSDDSDDEENAYDQQMINDNSGEKADEKQLAALNALRERDADEKQVAKLLKDITTGALRRRKNGDDEFDLDDSDDELLARRRQKQREFARMRKALLADEKVGEIAENPKKAAFFKAIEDRDDDDDGFDFLDDEREPNNQEESSQNVESGQQDGESNKRKRPLEPSAEDIANRPPPNLRRKPASAMSKKPQTLAEIRETLSFLTETPEYDSFHEDASMEDPHEQEEHEEQDVDAHEEPAPESKEEFAKPTHPRRTRGPVVDRLALLRQASSNSATSSGSSKLAFHAGSGNDATNIGFRPPQLLRKNTGGSTSASSTTSSHSRRGKAPPGAGASMAKKGAVNYYTAAREKERERELRSKQRSSGSNISSLLKKHAGNRLGALGGKGQWD